jgi:hypothetical protein
MSTSTLIFERAVSGEAQVTPKRYPSTISIIYAPTGEEEAFYGVDGQAPSIRLPKGTTKVTINTNSLQLAYRIINGATKLQWEVD